MAWVATVQNYAVKEDSAAALQELRISSERCYLFRISTSDSKPAHYPDRLKLRRRLALFSAHEYSLPDYISAKVAFSFEVRIKLKTRWKFRQIFPDVTAAEGHFYFFLQHSGISIMSRSTSDDALYHRWVTPPFHSSQHWPACLSSLVECDSNSGVRNLRHQRFHPRHTHIYVTPTSVPHPYLRHTHICATPTYVSTRSSIRDSTFLFFDTSILQVTFVQVT